MGYDYDSSTIDRDRNRNQRDRGSTDHRDRDRRARGVRGSDDQRDPRFGPDSYREGMPRNETERLISSKKVEGTAVYDINGKNLGSICTLMMDKRTGQTAYAVLKNSGGFLGLNERYYPLDWRELEYDTRVHGYGVDFSEDDLERREGYDMMGRRLGGSDRSRSRDDQRRGRW